MKSLRCARAILAFVITVVLALAPFGAGLAASGSQPMAAMEDCDQGGKGGCPCCDNAAQCPPDLCLAKCFKLVGEKAEPPVTFPVPSQLLLAERLLRPPDSSQAPELPPPRT